MRDALLNYLYISLPNDSRTHLDSLFQNLENSNYSDILKLPLVRHILGHDEDDNDQDIKSIDAATSSNTESERNSWTQSLVNRLNTLLLYDKCPDRKKHFSSTIPPSCYKTYFLIVALASLNAFLQTNITGPPLDFQPEKLLLSSNVLSDAGKLDVLRHDLQRGLAIDGVSVYALIPHLELFGFAKALLDCLTVTKNGEKCGNINHCDTDIGGVTAIQWTKLRLQFLHQKLLTEVLPSLQAEIFENITFVEQLLIRSTAAQSILSEFSLEKAAVCNHYGLESEARACLNAVAKKRNFQYKLTGVLGKRTRFQQEDVSQLVVLARSNESNESAESVKTEHYNGHVKDDEFPLHMNGGDDKVHSRPLNVNLNDDTLLDNISFNGVGPKTNADEQQEENGTLKNPSSLASLASTTALHDLDPSNQPLLEPLDSVTLLLYASSITNTSPSDTITREETLPFATRVLQGGSSNWQIYSLALLLRSRIEGYSSRTTERGLLQLQALVDQIIIELTSPEKRLSSTNTFLPDTQPSSIAPVAERLRYIWLLSPPTRWELEIELAARWTSLGGLKSALEIYERLQMWPEIALCWAGIEREDKARRVIRRQLFWETNRSIETYGGTRSEKDINKDQKTYQGPPKQTPPANAPRLYCILGDIDHDPAMYEAAWAVSNGRYARAQRSLGRFYFARKSFGLAAESYQKALKVSAIAEATWFALGCTYLELEEFERAVEAFSRAVQLNGDDAEAWSNLAAALLHLDRRKRNENGNEGPEEEEDKQDISRYRRNNRLNALKALKHAARLKHDNFHIWENLLTVAASTSPPSYTDIITAQTRLIEIRGPVVSERAVDVEIMEQMIGYFMHLDNGRQQPENHNGTDSKRHGNNTSNDANSTTTETNIHSIQRLTAVLFSEKVVPLITSSSRLWNLASRFYNWKGNPKAALDASEKAWRCTVNGPTVADAAAGTGTAKKATGPTINESEDRWNEVVDATIDLVDAYESLGGMMVTTTGTKASGNEGQDEQPELVAKDWRFKARSALRSAMGKGKESWEGTEGWERLVRRLEELKTAKG